MAGYVRNDTPNNIADGNIINAADLDGEFDSLQSAFGAAGGHSHSGAAGEGKPIEKVGPAQDLSVSIAAVIPKTTNTLDLGTGTFKFKDAYVAGKVDTGTITLGGTAVTSSAAELNLLDGVTATTAELNVLDGLTATTTELNYVDGVTSSIQTQLGTKQATITGAATTVVSSNLTADFAVVSDATGKIATHPTVSSTELGYLDGVTSAIQTQLGTKAPLASPALTGNPTITSNSTTPALTITQTGTGAAFLVEDSTSPDASPFIIDTAGNVGIGTTSPTSNLHVYNANAAISMNEVAAAGTGVASTRWKYGTNQFGLYVGPTNALIAYDYGAAAERMRIDASGNVGIGTSSGTGRLTVADGTTAVLTLRATSAIDPAGRVIGTINFQEPEGTGDGTLTVESSISALREGSDAFNSGGYLTFSTRPFNGSLAERMRVDASGNVGIGVTPSAWNSAFKAIEIGRLGDALFSGSGGGPVLSANGYYASDQWRYGRTGSGAANYDLNAGTHKWYIAPSGTAGNAITFTQAMTLDNSGNLGIGTTAPLSKLHVNTGAAGYGITVAANTQTSNEFQLGIDSSSNFAIYDTTAAANRMVISPTGNVGIGTSSPTTKLDVSGTVNATALSIGGTALTATAAELNYVDGVTSAIQTQLNAKAPLTAAMPSGGIIIWSGSSASIPSGWYLCDGLNGTPNLRDRFVVGAGTTYAVGATGGQNAITSVPAHDHGVGNLANASNGAHTHTGTTASGGDHNHLGASASGNSGNASRYPAASTNGNTSTGINASISWMGSSGNHTHTFTTDSNGAHTHTISGNVASSGSASVDVRPPYYALCYIMKA